MEEIVIKASQRHIIGKQVKSLRKEGKLPAVVYGRHIDPLPITLDYRDASRTLQGLSLSALIRLHVDGEDHFVLVRDKQRDILRGFLTHVDFQAVSMTEKVRAVVRIEFEGESPAVTEHGGILVSPMERLEVESLPGDLPEVIKVDVSVLKEVGDMVNVRDLDLPKGVTLSYDPEETVAVVTWPEAELVEEEVEEALEEELEPELVERKREEEKEEEEPEE
ncbi:MAG: 50S ribosomal protein L25 [Anaerolineales bacterium]|nr:50S ribosomal protein L25 [Anaerolineales bacterium]